MGKMVGIIGKHIVIGITGSIAAYKSCTLIRLLVKAGAEVQVVMSEAAKEFITPLTLSTLTSKPVVSDFFSRRDGSWNSHVDLGQWADAMVIAPATASTIAKMAGGIADNMLLTTYLAMKAPVFVAPAMDLDMFRHPATQKNLEVIKSYGNAVIEPREGELASHLVGKGRMEEPENIFRYLSDFFTPKKLLGKRVMITAGPTYENIDPVRFIGNYSSGKMGFAIAEACAAAGADVHLIAGPVSLKAISPRIRRTDVTSAAQMYETAVSSFPDADIAILSAAVADFTPQTSATQKIKREKDLLTLTLKPTNDIAQALGQAKKESQILVGFALETNNEVENARAKCKKKKFDFIVLNSLNDKGAGFSCDTNKVSFISAGSEKSFPLKPKSEVAQDIVNAICELLSSR